MELPSCLTGGPSRWETAGMNRSLRLRFTRHHRGCPPQQGKAGFNQNPSRCPSSRGEGSDMQTPGRMRASALQSNHVAVIRFTATLPSWELEEWERRGLPRRESG